MTFADHYQALIQKVRTSRKYRALQLPDSTLRDLLEGEDAKSTSLADLEDRFRSKLHNLVAPYLENIDYQAEMRFLTKNADSLFSNINQEKRWAESLMRRHASSRERLPYLDEFYATIWEAAGTPTSILDLACAIDPLGLPWMNLPPEATYFAYDIHLPRVNFLNKYFELAHPNAHAVQQDILLNPPSQQADLAFFFKEAHRLEKRQPGILSDFFTSIPAKQLVVSLPETDLSGHHHLDHYHRSLIFDAIQDKDWQLTERQVGDELLFFIKKTA